MKLKLLIFLFLVFLCKRAYSENLFFIPKTFLILPEKSTVKIKWIVSPSSKSKPQTFLFEKLRFVINYKNEPLIIYGDRLLFNPLTNYLVRLEHPVKDIVCLDNGVLLLSDGQNIGYLEEAKFFSANLPVVSIKVLLKLPINDAKLFKGEESVYALGIDKKTQKYEVYLFNQLKKQFQKIASFNEPIAALSGKKDHLYLAIDKQIKEYKNGEITIIYEHPQQQIKELFYNDKVGLIYKTSTGAGLVKDGSALEFLQSENMLIFLKHTSLFVLLPSVSAVFQLTNIDDLNNYNFNVEKIIDIQSTY